MSPVINFFLIHISKKVCNIVYMFQYDIIRAFPANIIAVLGHIYMSKTESTCFTAVSSDYCLIVNVYKCVNNTLCWWFYLRNNTS